MDLEKRLIEYQAALYNALPASFGRILNRLRVVPSYLNWRWRSEGLRHARAVLEPHRDRYKNSRCIIIGNGPSLRKMDLGILRGEFTFGLNRIYLLFPEWGFRTNFLVAINRFVIKQYAEEIHSLQMLKILNWKHRGAYAPDEKTAFICSRPSEEMHGNILKGYFTGGGTVTNAALEVAFYMGFEEVILIGVDHTYSKKGDPGKPIRSAEADKDHFDPTYFGPGAIWQLPNYVTMEEGYKRAKALFEGDGRRIVDGTLGGKLQIFPKVDFYNYLSESNFKNQRSP